MLHAPSPSRLPVTRIARIHLQSEAAECGLACLATIAGHHGLAVDLRTLRRRFPVSLKGVTLAHLMRHAGQLQLSTRALRCEPDELAQLQVPCILHWNLDHFVVLEAVTRGRVVVIDPARGRRAVPPDEVSSSFTGVALELTPSPAFTPSDARRRVRLRDLTGRVIGLKRALVNVLAVAAALEVVALVHPVATQFVVDGALVTGDRDLLTLAAIGGATLLAIDFVLRMVRGWISLRIDQQLAVQWTARLFAHLLRLPMRFFEQRHLGDITSRFASLTAIRGTLTNGAVAAALDGAMSVATLALMTIYSARLTAVAVAALALYVAIRAVAFRPLRDATEERIVLAAKENSFFLESIRAVLPLKLHGRVAERLSRWQNLFVDVQNRDVATRRMTLAFASAATLIAGIEGVLLLYLGGLAVLERAMSLGMLLAFLAYRTQFGERATKLVDLAIDVRMLGLHAERLADIALEPREAEAEIELDTARIAPRLEVRNLSFRYADGEPWVLRNVDLVVEAGESIAIVGASGCGKTTLLKLLLGLFDPVEGEIRIGDASRSTPIRQLGSTAYRALVGTVMQDDVLLSGSLADNIACFDPQIDRDAIEAAARRAAVHDDIVAMPMGYQTLVGEMGSALSGGQRQRVLLARALYKAPKLLALDEATSHLDLDNERRVNAAIAALSLTRITIAHRPETIAAAGRVVVLDGGRVARDVRLASQSVAA
jgi:ATP-binding cassette, subfamily B, bacterial CvaB/MchF/RaxB